jgi:hypothetical protein
MHGGIARKGSDLSEQEECMACANPNAPVFGDLVRLYQISWEAWPQYSTVSGKERRVGFELELCGAHEPGLVHLGTGCLACRHTYAVLRGVADRILPAPGKPSMCQVCPCGYVLRYSAARGSRPDVVLRLKAFHTQGLDVTDSCELRCLEGMKVKLTELGAHEQRWSSQDIRLRREHANLAHS